MRFTTYPVLLILSTILLVTTGCTTLPLSGPLPNNLVAEKITAVDDGAPFAISPDGTLIALAQSGLKLFHVPSKDHVAMSPKVPVKLAWSPSGQTLAALYQADGKSTIITYDSHGIVLASTIQNGPITDLAWLSDDELLAGGVVLKDYRFGTNYSTTLYRWLPGKNLPVAIPLRDTTLQPVTISRSRDLLLRGPMMDISPTTGHLLYLQPVDPPVLTPYYKLVLRELASGREMEIAPLGNLNAVGGRFSADGEILLHVDGKSRVIRYNPWSERKLGEVTTPGKNLALSPDGAYWFADGSLYHENSLVAPLAPGGTAQFAKNGSALFIACQGDLYRISGLRASGPVVLQEKILQLRSWKMEGLISAQEYTEGKERLKKP